MGTARKLAITAKVVALLLLVTRVSCFDYIFAFGDSYTAAGFNINGEKPSAANIIGNPPFPGYTYSGGGTNIEFAALNRTNTLLYDFAYPGAPVDSSLTPADPPNDSIIDFVHQTQEFLGNLVPAPDYADWDASNSFFTIFFGINDISRLYNATTNAVVIDPNIFQVYRAQVEALYAAGARRFVLLTVPPFFEAPIYKVIPGFLADATSLGVTSWNQHLQSLASDFQAAHADVSLQLYDTQPVWDFILENPTVFGAPNNTCTNADGFSCLFYDGLHPGVEIQWFWGLDIATLLK